MNLNYYQDQFAMVNEYKNSEIRDKQLAILMTNMEYEFSVPLLNDETYNKDNPNVIKLYRKVISARI